MLKLLLILSILASFGQAKESIQQNPSVKKVEKEIVIVNVINTPFEKLLKRRLEGKGTVYNKFITFLVYNKFGGKVSTVSDLLNSDDIYLGYYEGLIKAAYFRDKKQDHNSLLMAETVYDRGFDKLVDSTSGIYLQDLFLHYKIFDKANSLVTSPEICHCLGNALLKEGCVKNNLLISCIYGDTSVVEEYVKLAAENKLNDLEDVFTTCKKYKKKKLSE